MYRQDCLKFFWPDGGEGVASPQYNAYEFLNLILGIDSDFEKEGETKETY